jgi:hypothetical protein
MSKRIESIDSLSDLTSEDILDSRDLNELLERLEGERDGIAEDGESDDEVAASLKEWDEDNGELLKALQELRDECEGSGWQHGIGFIRDSYFKDYAQELADDIGAIDKNASWPNTCIDWDKAASELQTDYTSTEIGGIDYWWREA